MGATQGTLSYKIFYVHGDLPKNLREVFLPKIRENAFRPLNPEDEVEESMGWVVMDSPLDTEFSEEKVFYKEFLRLSIRQDKFVIPSSILNAQFANVEAEYLREHGKKRLTKFEKEDLLQELRIELKHQSIPRMAITDVVWNIPQNRIRFWGQSTKACEIFQDFFNETFGLKTAAANPYNNAGESGFNERELGKIVQAVPAVFTDKID